MQWGAYLLVSVLSLMADAWIWIIFSPWYRWQLATHPETKHHILQLHVNRYRYLCPRNTKTYSNHFHAHTLWRALSFSLSLLYSYSCENQLNFTRPHFCICWKVILTSPHSLRLSLQGSFRAFFFTVLLSLWLVTGLSHQTECSCTLPNHCMCMTKQGTLLWFPVGFLHPEFQRH